MPGSVMHALRKGAAVWATTHKEAGANGVSAFMCVG